MLVATLGLAAAPAIAGDTFTFTATDGVWGNDENWDGPEGRYPEYGDTAIIPGGKTCRVEKDDQHAKIIQVSGTLGIVGKKLALGQNFTPTTSTVNGTGTVYFKEVGGVRGTLAVRHWVTIDGSGKLTGSKGIDSTYAGRILLYGEQVGDEPPYGYIVYGLGIILDDTVVLTGTVQLWCRIEIKANAAVVVDYPDDVFNVADVVIWNGGNVILDGDGEFQVSAGALVFKMVWFDPTTPLWRLTGGEIELFDNPMSNIRFLNIPVRIVMTGGTFDVNDPLSTTGGLEFSGGQIEVAPNKTAEFFERSADRQGAAGHVRKTASLRARFGRGTAS